MNYAIRISLLMGALVLGACSAAGGGEVAMRSYWDWQLSSPMDFSKDLQVLDVHRDDISAEQIAQLKARGVKLIAYMSVGTLEDYRDDAGDFPPEVIGKRYGDWPDERFLDIRNRTVLLPLMRVRMAKAKAMGFDAIEPDNMDVYAKESGFDISADQTVAYLTDLAEIAHGMGMEIAQKNVPELTDRLVGSFDFIVTESCYQDGWCDKVAAYSRQGKDILDAEYNDRLIDWDTACGYAQKHGVQMILKDRDLTKELTTC